MTTQSTPDFSRKLREHMNVLAESMGHLLVDGFHYLALFAIGGAIIWSAFASFIAMGAKGHAAIDDILLLFIYLELGAMVGIYFKTNHMPVRFLLYVAMTTLAHQMISVVQVHGHGERHLTSTSHDVLVISIAMLVLALATLVIRFGSAKFPVVRDRDEKSNTSSN